VSTEAVEGAGDHLSIGEVLDELQREFPDVTISKIRFLESQGLIDPERTPSGYRRFYSPDLERLRWILVQQRDHFLPLRVIKERLDAFGPTGAPRLSSNGDTKTPTPAPAPAPEAPPARDIAPPAPVAAETPAPVPVPAPKPTPAPSTPASTAAPSAPQPAPRPAPVASAATPKPATPPPRPTPPAARPSPPPSRPKQEDPPRPAAAEINEDADVEDDEERFGSVRPARESPASTDLTRVELLEATGLTDSQLDALESFGILVSADGDDGRPRYDDENLAVGELAAGWYRRGIEARHLKMYSNFAEREARLLAQVLLPYLRQRNPDAKAKLQGELEELTRLGRRLRTAMLRRALRGLLRE
jgi:DNA-binding transcriptional MerR regulator